MNLCTYPFFMHGTVAVPNLTSCPNFVQLKFFEPCYSQGIGMLQWTTSSPRFLFKTLKQTLSLHEPKGQCCLNCDHLQLLTSKLCHASICLSLCKFLMSSAGGYERWPRGYERSPFHYFINHPNCLTDVRVNSKLRLEENEYLKTS